MRKINRGIHEIAQDQPDQSDSAILLAASEQRRFSGDIVEVMGALGCLITAQVYGALFPTQDVVTGFIYLMGVLIIGIPIAVTAVRGFLQREMCSAMEILVTIAMLISLLNNEYLVAILIPLLLTLVHFLEERSIVGGRDAINGLKKMQSTRAFLLKDGAETEVDARALKAGDIIVVKPGMSFPIDGRVLSGISSVNQQSLTGETLPCDVAPGSPVYAGTLNIQGALRVTVEKAYADTSFQKIVHMLEESGDSATPESRLVNQFMTYYIPAALIVATLVWLFTKQIDRAVAILVVSCPCGHMLVSSAPLIASLAALSRRGILVKSAGFIEKLTELDTIFFDKTGTLTSGEIRVKALTPADGVPEKALVEAALAVAVHSAHPLSVALGLLRDHCDALEGFEVTEHGGRGLVGIRGKESILMGSEAFLGERGIEASALAETSDTAVFVARSGRFLGAITFSDTLREDAPEMVRSLRALGIQNTTLLTGDRETIAQKIRLACDLDSAYAQLLPEQKLEIVKNARAQHCVGFVGDGINDALALREADVGISMGAIGNDTAIQSADIALMNNRLDNIPYAMQLARRARSIIRQNVAIAFLTSLVMITLAALGIITPLPGALLHNIGAFIVLINSGRILKKDRPDERPAKTESVAPDPLREARSLALEWKEIAK